MSLFAAILTATVVAAFGVPFRHYQCWYSWSRVSTNIGVAGYFAVAAGGGGLLAWVAAEAANVHPSSNPLVNGVLYGLVAGAVLRADFGVRPKHSAGHAYREASSIVAKCLTWMSNTLDDIAYRHAENWLRHRTDDQLLDEALRVRAHIDQKPLAEVNNRQKNEIFKKLLAAIELLPTARRAEGRAHLVTFCAKYYIKEHLAKTREAAAAPERAVTR
jgi:hypothetical protein